MITDRTMRWRERRARYVPITDDFIDTRRYSAAIVEPHRAAAFIAAHHYLPTMPVSQLCVGLFGPRRAAPRAPLVGCAIYAVPSTPAVISAHTALEPEHGSTLARFLLLDDVPANGETFFLARAMRLLRSAKPHLEAVVSYADPSAGHIGHIYAAASATHRGKTRPRTSWSIAGETLPGRTLSKIRREDRGHERAIDRLISLGARKPAHGEHPRAWLEALAREGGLKPSVHPGYFVYAFPLTKRARARSRRLPCVPYPRMVPGASEGSVPHRTRQAVSPC